MIIKRLGLRHKTVTASGRKQTRMIAAIVSAVAITFASVDARAQEIFNETFDTDNLKDPATTADWDTAPGITALQFPESTSAAPIDSLTGVFPDTQAGTVIAGEALATRAVVVGDLDGDGDQDLVFANNGKNSVFFNNGFGTFTRGSDIPDDNGGTNTRSAAVADFNGDGHLDVVFAEFGSGQATRIHFNNGSGSTSVFTAGDFADLGDPTIRGDSVAVGDIDSNGTIDVVVGVRGDFVKVFRNDGFGNFSVAEDVSDPEGAAALRVRSVLLGDLEGDGDLDLVAAREEADTRVYLNNGAGSFGAPQSVGGGDLNSLHAPDSADLGDVDGDGLLDLIIGNDFVGSTTLPSPQPNRLYLNSGNPADIYPAASTTFADVVNTNAAGFVDVDRDGDLDIVIAAYDLGNGQLEPGRDRLYLNNAGVFPTTGVLLGSNNDVSKSFASGDFDGNGTLDLVFANDAGNANGESSTADNIVMLNAGTQTGTFEDQLFATGQSLQVGAGADLSRGVILRPNTNETEANRVYQYWLSDDGGISWIVVEPFRSISFPTPLGNDLRWRVELNSPSPALRPELGQLRLTSNIDPSIDSTAVTTATQNDEYTYDVLASDPNGELVDISASVLPAWLTLTDDDDGTATLIGTPTNDDVGTVGNDVTIQVVDAAGRTDTQSFTIDVADANDAPVLVPAGVGTGDQTFNQGETVNLDTSVGFSDPDGDTLTYSATGLPPSLTLDANTGILSGTLTNDDAFGGLLGDGVYAVVIKADDGNTGTVDDDFTFTVDDINDAPSITSTPVTAATEGVEYTYAVVAEDIDGNDVTITAVALPAWLTLTDSGLGTATLSGTPTSADTGQVNITLSVSDGSLAGEQSFSITVIASADAPVITITGDNPATVEQGDAYTDAGATAADAQDGDLTASITTTSNVDTDAVGTYSVTYSVSDSGGNQTQAQRVVNVVDTAAPVITLTGSATVTLTVGDTYSEQGATADDGLNGDISADIVIDNSGVDTAVAGTYTVTYNVSDASGNAATEITRTVVVNDVATPPPPPPSGGGGGGATSLLGLLLLAGVMCGRRLRKLIST